MGKMFFACHPRKPRVRDLIFAVRVACAIVIKHKSTLSVSIYYIIIYQFLFQIYMCIQVSRSWTCSEVSLQLTVMLSSLVWCDSRVSLFSRKAAFASGTRRGVSAAKIYIVLEKSDTSAATAAAAWMRRTGTGTGRAALAPLRAAPRSSVVQFSQQQAVATSPVSVCPPSELARRTVWSRVVSWGGRHKMLASRAVNTVCDTVLQSV